MPMSMTVACSTGIFAAVRLFAWQTAEPAGSILMIAARLEHDGCLECCAVAVVAARSSALVHLTERISL